MTAKRPTRSWDAGDLTDGQLIGLILGIIGSIAIGVIGIGLILTYADPKKPDPFDARCDKAGGVVAFWSHGKTETSICIANGRVVETEGESLP